MVYVRMDGIDEHHACDFLSMASGEYTKVECSEIMPNENVRARNVSAGEEPFEFAGDIRAAARLIWRVAPTKTGTIVRTHTRRFTDLRLNQLPDK
jgi:hypothetical protein